MLGGSGIGSSNPQNELHMTILDPNEFRNFTRFGLAKANFKTMPPMNASFMVYLTHKNPQQAEVFFLCGITVANAPTIPTGPGTFTTIGIFKASAALAPDDERISTMTMSGFMF